MLDELVKAYVTYVGFIQNQIAEYDCDYLPLMDISNTNLRPWPETPKKALDQLSVQKTPKTHHEMTFLKLRES